MPRRGSRGWAAFCLIGIALWIGVTVLVAVLNDDPSDGGPVLLAFAGGGAAFFAAVFGVAWWQTRPQALASLPAGEWMRRYTTLKTVNLQSAERHTKGQPDAPVTISEFVDFR